MKRLFHRLLAGGATLLGLPVAALAVGLLIVAETAPGRFTAAACVIVPVAAIHWAWRRGIRWPLSALGLALGVGCLIAARALTPSAAEVRATGISVYLGARDHDRLALANLVPEIDQFTLGSHLVHHVDPIIDPAQAARIRGLFQQVYRELRADPVFARAGSTMDAAYGELLGLPWRNEHLYRYPPEGAGPARPVILFLHGSAGNFLGYLWVLKRFADAHGWAVVAPDYGFGNWNHGDPEAVFAQLLRYIDTRPDLDGTRIVLTGLSNGGLGVGRALRHAPQRYRAVVLFSAITDLIDQGVPIDAPFHLLHGAADRRIPLHFIEQSVARLRAAGARVALTVRPSDHFLFFEDRAAVEAILRQATDGL